MKRACVRLALWLLRRFANLRRSDELGDVLAYLEKRRRRAEVIAGSDFDQDGRGRTIARELAVTIGDLQAGLHHGEAEIQALAVGGEASA